MQEQKKNQERLDNLFWKKYSNWYLKFKKFDDEEFKKIEGYLGFYFISNHGQVISFQEKSPQIRRYSFINGFFGVNLSLFGVAKFHFVHELVYSHFVGERKSDRTVVHINGVVTDNYYKNLRLARPGESKRKSEKKYDFSLSDRIEAEKPGKKVAAVPIMQFDKDGKFIREYPSIKKASAATGIDRNAIQFGLTGKTRLVKGYQWRYKKESHFTDGPHDIEAVQYSVHTRARSLLQFDLQGKFKQEYPSVMEASRITGISPASISECARGNLVTAGGFQWRFKDDPLFKAREQDGEYAIKAAVRRKPRNAKTILQFDLDGNFIREFPSISDARAALGFINAGFNRCISGKCLTAAGFQWRMKNDPIFKEGVFKLPPVLHRDLHKAKPVLQFSVRGKFIREYPSLNEATRISGISKVSIMRCLKGEKMLAGKFQWRFKKDEADGAAMMDIPPVKRAPRSKNIRPVYQFAINGAFIREYPSIIDAARASGVDSAGIRACAAKIYKRAGGYQWFYKNDPALARGFSCVAPLPEKIARGVKHDPAREDPQQRAHDLSTPVLQFDRYGKFLAEYPSVKEVGRKLKLVRSYILQCAKYKRKSSGGFQWRFKDDPIFKDGICDIEPALQAVKSEPILCFNLRGKFIAEYPSLAGAARELRINNGAISNCLKGNFKTAGGYQWKRKSDESFKNGIIDIAPIEKVTGWMRKEVLQFDLEGNFIRSYPSMIAAARDLDIGMSVIRRAIYEKGLTAAGYQWRSTNDPLFDNGIVSIPPLVDPAAKAKPLLQYNLKGNLKNEFRSIREAVEKTGISRYLILNCATGKRETAGGYTWKFKNP